MSTVGGSIWGRYGFSDVLTLFLAMDTWVELYKGGQDSPFGICFYGKEQRYPFAPDHQEKENQDLLSEPAKYKDRFSSAYLLRLGQEVLRDPLVMTESMLEHLRWQCVTERSNSAQIRIAIEGAQA